uniref:Uncharacterized protein n=1 Tax=Anguilla anguilla TaxID=7936 RepID=A0A0E9VAP4_ANGAN
MHTFARPLLLQVSSAAPPLADLYLF